MLRITYYRTILNYVIIISLTSPLCYSRLIDNVNSAIVSNIRDDFVNNTGGQNGVIGAFIGDFTTMHRTESSANSAEDKIITSCASRKNLSTCKQSIRKECLDIDRLLQKSLEESTNQTLSDWFPSLLYNIHNSACSDDESSPEPEHHREKSRPSSAQAWGYGIGFVTVICCVSNVGGFMAPFMKKDFFQRLLLFCVALAVGTLAATGFLVLIPESMELTEEDSPVPDYHFKMATVMGGVYFFFISERLLKIWFSRPKRKKSKDPFEIETEITIEIPVKENGNHGHSHSLGIVDKEEELTVLTGNETDTPPKKEKRKRKLTTLALIILIGDALHNFVDGIAIGAAFTENTYLGISVSLSVICEELPHELGDIAILLNSGLNMRRSLCYNFMAALTCYVGLVIGILLGENTNANMWIFAVAGGMFVYIALVDMVPEMSEQIRQVEEQNENQKFSAFLIQNIGLLTGFVIIMMLVMYGGNIEV